MEYKTNNEYSTLELQTPIEKEIYLLLQNVEDEVVSLYHKLKMDLLLELQHLTNHIPFTSTNIILLVRYAMELVEITPLKGTAQKAMVLELVHLIITNSSMEDQDKTACFQILHSGAISQMIEIIIQASHGELTINKAVKDTSTIASKCCFAFLQWKTNDRN